MAEDLAGTIPEEPKLPVDGSTWRHVKTGGDYVVDFLVNIDPIDPVKSPLGVVYHRVGELARYHLTWENFKQKFIPF